MGGYGAYNLAIKYRAEFAHVVGVFPPLNLRYQDCSGNYRANYDPSCQSFKQRYRPLAPIARFGPVTIRERDLLKPLFGKSEDPVADIARENPLEMLTAYGVRPGELNMFAGYGTEDELNIDAQVESFVDAAVRRGLTITIQKVPDGGHNARTAVALLPGVSQFLTPRVGPYSPR